MPVSKSGGSEAERLAGGVWFMVKRREKQAGVSALELGLELSRLKIGRSGQGMAKWEGSIAKT